MNNWHMMLLLLAFLVKFMSFYVQGSSLVKLIKLLLYVLCIQTTSLEIGFDGYQNATYNTTFCTHMSSVFDIFCNT
jgi:hypothetical protein